MLIIIDKKIPEPAKEKLSAYGELIEFGTSGMTYDAISGHPDIFFCKIKNSVIMALNTPDNYKKIFNDINIPVINGYKTVNGTYPRSASYNAVVTDKYLLHRIDITDKSIIENTTGLENINVNQGYCRCSLLPFNNNFITSDKGIYKTLSNRKLNVLYFQPDEIIFPGFQHGFFGGTCGVSENIVFIIGSLDHFTNGHTVREFINAAGHEIIELYDGPLFDGGSIIFLD
jgi:hypothetical protein